MFVPEELEKKIGETRYLIRALPASYGLHVMAKLGEFGNVPPSEFLKELILKSVTVNNIQPTEEWFNKHFSRNYKEMYDLFNEIVEFNFGSEDENSPNTEGGISD